MASSASLALSEAAWSFSFALSANTARSHFPSRPEAFYVNKGGTGRAGVSIAQLCEEKLSGKGGGRGNVRLVSRMLLLCQPSSGYSRITRAVVRGNLETPRRLRFSPTTASNLLSNAL
jgi:hypothetical protein